MSSTIDEEKLQSMGLDIKVGRFLLYDASWHAFFDWMVTNTTDENILTDIEIDELNSLRDQGLLLCGRTLEERLLELNHFYPGIMTYTDNDLLYAEQRLRNLTALEANYRDHFRHLVTLCDDLDADIVRLEEEAQYKREHEKRLFQICLEEASFIENSNGKLEDRLKDMYDEVCDRSHTSMPLFMSQMPLKNFNDGCSLFLKHVDMFVTRQFASNEPLTADRLIMQVDDLKKKWAEVEEQYFLTRLDVVGRAHIVEKLLRKPVCCMDECELERLVCDLKKKNAATDAQFEALYCENQILTKKVVQADCDLLLQRKHEAKKAIAMQRREKLTYLQKTVTHTLSYAELLWLIMKIDLDMVDEQLMAFKGLNVDDLVCAADHSAVSILARRNIKAPVDSFETEVLELQKKFLADHFFVSRNIFETTEEIHYTVACQKRIIADNKHIVSFWQEYNKLASIDQSLIDFVLDGASELPYMKPNHIVLGEAKRMERKRCTEAKINRMMTVFENSYVHRLKTDELWAAKQMLWVWFLMDKRRAIMALQEVTKLAKTTAAYTKLNPTFEINKFAMN